MHGRVWRWAQRRPVVAALATSICLVTASGLIAVVWFGSSAASHRRQAETNLRQTQEAVRIFTEAIDEQLQGVPDSQAARVSLLQTGLRYYEHFVRQQSDDPALQAELAHAHERIGSIQHEIGSATAALDSHRRALELRRRLAQQSPDDFKRKRHLAHSIYEVASLLKERGELAEALTLHREAAHLRQQLCEQTGELESHRELVWSQLCIGQLLADTENNEAAQQCYQDARNRLVELGSRFRDDEKIQTDLAVVLNRLGLLRREMNDSSGAVEFHREALARLRPMHESHEQSSGLARELAATYHYLGLLRREAEPDQALADFMNGLKLREAIVSREPNVARYEADLATSYTYVGQHYLRAGKGDDAFGYYERASDIHARHVQLDSTNVRSRMRLGQSWQGMAEGCVLMRDLDRALRCLAQATGVWRTLVEQFPEERLYRETLADHWCRIGQLQFERKEYSSALQTLENGRGEYLHLLSKFPAQKKSLEPKLNGASGFIAITRERLE